MYVSNIAFIRVHGLNEGQIIHIGEDRHHSKSEMPKDH